MRVNRRTALRVVGAAGGTIVLSGQALASGEPKDDHEPEPDEPEPDEPDHEEPDPEEPAPESAVRVAHFSPDAPNVDVLVEGEPVLEDVPYEAVSEYLDLPAGTYGVTITAAGDPEAVVFDDEVTVEEPYYTAAAIGELEAETFEPLVLVDADDIPEEQALVRLVHASPDAPAVDVFAGDAPLYEDVAFGEDSEYLEVEPGPYTLDVFPAAEPEEPVEEEPANEEDAAAEPDDADDEPYEPANDDEAPADDEEDPAEDPAEEEPAEPVASFDVEVEAGVAYTAFAIGYLDPEAAGAETDREFTLNVTQDGPSAVEEPVEEEPAEEEPAEEPAEEEPAEEEPAEEEPAQPSDD